MSNQDGPSKPEKQPKRQPAKREGNKQPDPFAPESLRLGQNYADALSVKKKLLTLPCRKPNRHEYVRVRPGEDWRLETAALEDKIHRETYLVDRSLWPELAGEVYPVALFLAVNRQTDYFLWPVKLPGPDGRPNHWNDSALGAARLAETTWVRIVANMGAGLYDVFEATGELSAPEWPQDLTFPDALKLAFRDRFIDSPNHAILRRLQGAE